MVTEYKKAKRVFIRFESGAFNEVGVCGYWFDSLNSSLWLHYDGMRVRFSMDKAEVIAITPEDADQ